MNLLLVCTSNTTIGEQVGCWIDVPAELWWNESMREAIFGAAVRDSLAWYASRRQAEPTGPVSWKVVDQSVLPAVTLEEGVWNA